MAMTIKIETVGNEIFLELGSPTDVSVGVINFWLQSNIGLLNTLINSSYTLNDAGNEISPALGLAEKDIYKTLYNIYYYDKQIRASLGAGGITIALEVASDGGTVKTVNRNEISKSYIQMKKEEQIKLNKLISLYKSNNGNPIQIVGDDTFSSEPIMITPSYDRNRLG